MMKKEVIFAITIFAIIASTMVGYYVGSNATNETTVYSYVTSTTTSYSTVTYIPTKTLNSVIVRIDTTYESTVEGNTTIVVVPVEYSVAAQEIKYLLEIDNDDYLEYVKEKAYSESIIPPRNITDFDSWGTYMTNVSYYFVYDVSRAELVSKTPGIKSYYPDELLSIRSGICGDFALFYAAQFLAENSTITFILIYRNAFAHAALDVSGIVMQNNNVGTYVESFLGEWHHNFGDYTAYLITVDRSGLVGMTTTIVTTGIDFPHTFIETIIVFGNQSFVGSFYRSGTIMTMFFTDGANIFTYYYSNGTMSAVSNGTTYTTTTDYYGAANFLLDDAGPIYPITPITVMNSSTTIYFAGNVVYYAYLTFADGNINGKMVNQAEVSMSGTYSMR